MPSKYASLFRPDESEESPNVPQENTVLGTVQLGDGEVYKAKVDTKCSSAPVSNRLWCRLVIERIGAEGEKNFPVTVEIPAQDALLLAASLCQLVSGCSEWPTPN